MTYVLTSSTYVLTHEKKNLLVKLFDANEVMTAVKIENMSLIEKVKSLEFELLVSREHIDRTSTSNFFKKDFYF